MRDEDKSDNKCNKVTPPPYGSIESIEIEDKMEDMGKITARIFYCTHGTHTVTAKTYASTILHVTPASSTRFPTLQPRVLDTPYQVSLTPTLQAQRCALVNHALLAPW